MTESISKTIPAINCVEGFNPADYVRVNTEQDGSVDAYLDAKYRILWFRLHHPEGKLDPEIIHTKSLKNLAKLVRIADRTRVIDNSGAEPSMICEVSGRTVRIWENEIWTKMAILSLLSEE